MYYLFSGNTILFLHFIKSQLFSYIFIENNNTENGKKKKEGKKEFGRTRTRHQWLDAPTPNHYTTETDYVALGKVFYLKGLCHGSPVHFV